MPADPIRIRPGQAGRLIVQLPYSLDHVAKIKSVAGCRWHPKKRHWTVYQGDEMLSKLLGLFPGKAVDIDVDYTHVLIKRSHGVRSPVDSL